MQLHEAKPHTLSRSKKRVGRGGKRGKTSGRGTKGQKARAGRKIRPEIRDAIKKLPKRRGYGKHRAESVNASALKPVAVNLDVIEKNFNDGDLVSPESLVAKKLVKRQIGTGIRVKILGTGAITKKLVFSKVAFSHSAKEKITKAHGTITG
ncbi:MAG: 50S ribosomal protein L15 [Candidatus Lloydbacteria bacterium]|nr:50S ribosomal protein L15 [Candidatus Lloydbacteria bacterium]